MKKRTLLLIVFLMVAVCIPPKAYSFTYSLVDDWSDSVNSNGVWSYNEGNNPLLYNLAGWPTNEFGSTQTAWANGNLAGNLLPAWFKSVIDPNQVGTKGPYDWLEGDVIVHSTDDGNGPNSGVANVIWTSPVSGIYDISGGLWGGRHIGRSNIWNLYLGDVLLDNGGATSIRSNPGLFDIQSLYITEGSVLRLDVLRISPSGDFVGVDFNINHAVPEPTTLLLLGFGFIGAFLKRRRA